MENRKTVTDHYEYTMGQTYFEKGYLNKKVYFDIFYRKAPFNSGYAIMGGLAKIVEYLENFKIDDECINFLRANGIHNEEYLKYLQNLKFTGSVYAVEDGTPIFPNEPVITIVANVIEAQLIETALLTIFNHSTLITTAAKRITTAAGNIGVMEFGSRRGPGVAASKEVSKNAYIGGCSSSSNVEACMEYDIPVVGTMAHSMICAESSEYVAFLNYAKSNPHNCVFLVDTYDTLNSGIPNAIKVAKEYLIPHGYKFKGIRIDSGDLAYISKEARKLLDKEGFYDTTICLTNGLNEAKIKSLIEQEAKVDVFGVGDNLAYPLGLVGGVYKLVAVEENGETIPKIKVSEDTIKTINPGYKKVYRFYDNETHYALGDVIALHNEVIPKDEYTLINPIETWKQKTITNYTVKELQVPIFIDGKKVYDVPTPKESREYCMKEFAKLYPEIKRSESLHEYYVDLSLELLDLKRQMILDIRNNIKRNIRKRVR